MSTIDKTFVSVQEAQRLLEGYGLQEFGPSYEFLIGQSMSLTGKTLLSVAATLFGLEWEILHDEGRLILHIDKPVYNTQTGEVNTGEKAKS